MRAKALVYFPSATYLAYFCILMLDDCGSLLICLLHGPAVVAVWWQMAVQVHWFPQLKLKYKREQQWRMGR